MTPSPDAERRQFTVGTMVRWQSDTNPARDLFGVVEIAESRRIVVKWEDGREGVFATDRGPSRRNLANLEIVGR